MAILIPGANAALTAENPGLTSVMVGLGWNIVPSRGPASEPVPTAILCGVDGTALSDEHLVFFNQIIDPAASVRFIGNEDREQIDVDLTRVPAEVHKISFVVYIDPDLRGPGTFASVRDAHIRIADPSGRELVRFPIPADTAANVSAMIFGDLYRHAGGWKFRAIGQGYTDGLGGIAADFRLSL